MATSQASMPAVVDTAELMPSIPSIRTISLIARDSPAPADDNEPCPKLGRATICNIVAAWVVCLSQAISVFTATSQAVAIAETFDSSKYAVCMPVALTMFVAFLGPLVSQGAEHWGRRKLFLVISPLGGIVGSVIIGCAPSFAVVVVGQALLGSALVTQPLLHTIVAEILPRRRRSFGQFSLLLATCIGNILGSIFAAFYDIGSDGWKLSYFILAGLQGAAALLAFTLYRSPNPESQDMIQRRSLVTIDWCWVALSSVILSLFYLSFFMSRFIDTSEHMSFIPLGLGLAFTIFLLTVEQKGKKAGFLHHKLFLHRNFHLSTFTAFAMGFVFVAFDAYFGLEIIKVYKSESVFPRDYYIMASASSILAGAIAAWYCSRYKAIRGVSSIGFAFCIPFYAAMADADQSTAIYAYIFPIFIGIALGVVMVTLPTVAQLSIPSQLLSVGNGVFFLLFTLGRFLGLVVYDSMFFSTLEQGNQNIAGKLIFAGVPKEHTATVIAYLKSGCDAPVPSVPGLTDAVLEVGVIALKDCYLAAFRAVWITACCFAGLSMLVSATMNDPKEQFTWKIDVPMPTPKKQAEPKA